MKTAVITGASRGIGRAAALRFAEAEPMNLMLNCGSSPDALDQVVQTIAQTTSSHALAYVGDVSDEAAVREMFEETEQSFGVPDVLICNAGIDWAGLLQDMTSEEWDRVLSVNLKSAFLSMKYAIPLMLKKHSGSIVLVSSVWGSSGGACEAAYSASKGGLNALARAMSRELAPSGIRVNAVSFGAIDTVMNDRLSREEKSALIEEIPLGRMGTPEEAADFIYDTAFHHPYMTGQILTMDGGWTV
ncbi:MAG: SDR family oxidoreductase [Lachnospiraceae bacterium]|nr:SDR family oxidoreductase [Lachnospiraceae bacterium]